MICSGAAGRIKKAYMASRPKFAHACASISFRLLSELSPTPFLPIGPVQLQLPKLQDYFL